MSHKGVHVVMTPLFDCSETIFFQRRAHSFCILPSRMVSELQLTVGGIDGMSQIVLSDEEVSRNESVCCSSHCRVCCQSCMFELEST